jgi:hypothetical protein
VRGGCGDGAGGDLRDGKSGGGWLYSNARVCVCNGLDRRYSGLLYEALMMLTLRICGSAITAAAAAARVSCVCAVLFPSLFLIL